jgi:hypothetical protein
MLRGRRGTGRKGHEAMTDNVKSRTMQLAGFVLLAMCPISPAQAPPATRTQANRSDPIAAGPVFLEQSVAYWEAIQHTPNIIETLGDNPWITTANGMPGGDVLDDEFFVFAKLLIDRSNQLKKMSTVGVDPELIEWNIESCVALELQAALLIKRRTFYGKVTNPFAGPELILENAGELIKSLDPKSPQTGLLIGVVRAASAGVLDLNRFHSEVLKVRDDTIKRKYQVRMRVSQRIASDLPLSEDGCPTVYEVAKQGLAAGIGLQVGDVLLSYDQISLEDESIDKDALAVARQKAQGKSVVVLLARRNGKVLSFQVPGGKTLGIVIHPSSATLPVPWARYVPEYRQGYRVWISRYPFRGPSK